MPLRFVFLKGGVTYNPPVIMKLSYNAVFAAGWQRLFCYNLASFF